MIQHTHGKLEISTHRPKLLDVVQVWDGEPRVVATFNEQLAWHENRHKSEEEAYANALLFTAAPDLLAACEAVNEWDMSLLPCEPPWYQDLLTAIKKARGTE